LGKLLLWRQQKQRVGHSDGDLAVVHGFDQLWRSAALNAPDPFSFGG
jgi:hypothetical protein